jgi:hypothetical protein
MNPFKFVTAPSVGTRIDHTLQWLTESPLALLGKYVVSLIVSHYSDRLLARIIHEGSLRKRADVTRERHSEA